MIDFSNLNKALRAYDTKQVVAALGEDGFRNPEAAKRFVTALRESSILVVQIEDNVREALRDELVLTCRALVASCPDRNVIEDFENHVADASIAEKGYRELFESLRKSDIWKCPPTQQAWGMLLRAEREFSHVEAEIQKQLARLKKTPLRLIRDS